MRSHANDEKGQSLLAKVEEAATGGGRPKHIAAASFPEPHCSSKWKARKKHQNKHQRFVHVLGIWTGKETPKAKNHVNQGKRTKLEAKQQIVGQTYLPTSG
jgi:hypothetical protein